MKPLSNKQLTMFTPTIRKPGGLDGCPRKWGFCYLDGLKVESFDPALVTGIKFHNACQSLVENDRLPDDVPPESDLGKMARKAILWLPKLEDWDAKPLGCVHGPWNCETREKFPWTTRAGNTVEIDLRCDVVNTPRPDPHHFDPLVFIDWKSTSGKQWALKDLREDLQPRLYAYGNMLLRDKLHAHGRWIYVLKKPPFTSWPLDADFTRHETKEWLHGKIDRAIDLILELRQSGLTGLQLPMDRMACEGVGKRCDYVGHCNFQSEGVVLTLDEITGYLLGEQ